jgi:hypothetical protein
MIPAARPARPSRRPLRKPRRGPTLDMRDQRANDFVQVTWETPNGLENSKNRRSAGGHGNQHVRLRSAQVRRSRRSARPVATVSGRGRRPLCFGFAEIRRGAQRPAQTAAGSESRKISVRHNMARIPISSWLATSFSPKRFTRTDPMGGSRLASGPSRGLETACCRVRS